MHVTSKTYYIWYNSILNTQPELQYYVGIYILKKSTHHDEPLLLVHE